MKLDDGSKPTGLDYSLDLSITAHTLGNLLEGAEAAAVTSADCMEVWILDQALHIVNRQRER